MTTRTFPERRTSGAFGTSSFNQLPAAKRKGAIALAGISPFTVSGTAPEIRQEEVDQTDPAGRYRTLVTGDSYNLQRALTAAWATVLTLMSYDVPNTNWLFNALQSNAWYIELLAGIASTPGTNAAVFVGGSTASPAGVDIRTGNAGGGSLLSRILVNIGAGSPDIDISNAILDMNSNNIKKVEVIGGDGVASLYLRANYATTDATAYRILMDVLDPATDTFYTVAQAVPKAATPLFTFAGSDYVPTTSELDAGHYYIGYTKSTNTATLYMNEGGVIVSLVLGVMA